MTEPDPSDIKPDTTKDRTKPPPWAHKAWHRAVVPPVEDEALADLWAIHDEITAPAEARAREAERRAENIQALLVSAEERADMWRSTWKARAEAARQAGRVEGHALASAKATARARAEGYATGRAVGYSDGRAEGIQEAAACIETEAKDLRRDGKHNEARAYLQAALLVRAGAAPSPKSTEPADPLKQPYPDCLSYKGDPCTVCQRQPLLGELVGDTPAWGHCGECEEEVCPEHQRTVNGDTWCSECVHEHETREGSPPTGLAPKPTEASPKSTESAEAWADDAALVRRAMASRTEPPPGTWVGQCPSDTCDPPGWRVCFDDGDEQVAYGRTREDAIAGAWTKREETLARWRVEPPEAAPTGGAPEPPAPAPKRPEPDPGVHEPIMTTCPCCEARLEVGADGECYGYPSAPTEAAPMGGTQEPKGVPHAMVPSWWPTTVDRIECDDCGLPFEPYDQVRAVAWSHVVCPDGPRPEELEPAPDDAELDADPCSEPGCSRGSTWVDHDDDSGWCSQHGRAAPAAAALLGAGPVRPTGAVECPECHHAAPLLFVAGDGKCRELSLWLSDDGAIVMGLPPDDTSTSSVLCTLVSARLLPYVRTLLAAPSAPQGAGPTSDEQMHRLRHVLGWAVMEQHQGAYHDVGQWLRLSLWAMEQGKRVPLPPVPFGGYDMPRDPDDAVIAWSTEHDWEEPPAAPSASQGGPADEGPSDDEIRAILASPHGRRWTIQGFGMLRTYLTDDERVRLHVWSRADEVPGVSVIHDHPWDFTSRVVSGVVRNVRYMDGGHEPHWTRSIVCGPGGCALGTSERVMLGAFPDDVHGPGDTYSQAAPVLHASYPSDGAVTVITRRFGAERDVARVCWPDAAGPNGWVSAEPRDATPEEIERITRHALARWQPSLRWLGSQGADVGDEPGEA